MPKFRATVTVGYEVIVEAEDMYEADTVVMNLSQEEVLAGKVAWIDYDSD